ncbi:hypothetical protein [Streptomyces sp. NPDC088766]|uniref:hypothetical protein n=1 Tax=Streptomyces sp. NPDC088766 TaxID=3365893 RepID=UPI0038113699
MSGDGDPGGANGLALGGRYRLLERVGAGVTGTVRRARDLPAERGAAVRETRLPGNPGDEARRRAAHRLHHEARAAARVEHPCAVSLHDVVVEEGGGLRDGLPRIVMELRRRTPHAVGQGAGVAARAGGRGAWDEERGTAVLAAARDRLRIEMPRGAVSWNGEPSRTTR